MTTDTLGVDNLVSKVPSRIARTAVLAAAGLTIMAPALIAPSLPAMAGHFGNETLVRLALTITSLAIAVGAPLAGALADRVGRRPVLLTGLAVYAVAGTAGLVVTDFGTLLATRAVLGLGVGAVTTAVSTLLTDWFTGQRRATYLGYQQAAASLGGVVLLPLAGLLADVGWRVPFWLYAIGAPIAALTLVAVPRSGRALAEGAPPAGGTTATGAPRAATAGRVLGLYFLALAATAVFYMAPTQLPFLLGGLGAGPGVVGVAIAGSTLTSLAGSLTFPAVRRRLSPTAITVGALVLLGVGWTLIGQADALQLVVAGLLVGGVGVGLAVPNLNFRVGDLAPDGRRGRVLAGLVTSIFLGQFLSPLATGPFVATIGPEGAFTAAGLITTAGAVIAAPFLLRPHRGR